MSGEEATEIFRNAGKFYLWEGGFIGEATVVQNGGSHQPASLLPPKRQTL